jgi:hypothetical protein
MMKNGVEDTAAPAAEDWSGAHERLHLTPLRTISETTKAAA